MADLTTTYLGLQLKNPLVASASPFSKKVDHVRRLEDAGVSAVVMDSLFEEQIKYESHELNYFLERGTESFQEAPTYLPDLGRYNVGPQEYLDQIGKLKNAVQIPVIASLNGSTPGGWVSYARRMEQAGADALELNLYYLYTDPGLSSQSIEDNYVQLVSSVREQVSIPLAIKLSPNTSGMAHFTQRLVQAGANGLVLFNRFYQPDLDIENLEVTPNLILSDSTELRRPLRWIAILYGRIQADLALTSGVHAPTDLIKAVMAGASVAMTTSALLKRGIPYAAQLLEGVQQWMAEYEYESITQMRGSMSQRAVGDPAVFERANYIRALKTFDYHLA